MKSCKSAYSLMLLIAHNKISTILAVRNLYFFLKAFFLTGNSPLIASSIPMYLPLVRSLAVRIVNLDHLHLRKTYKIWVQEHDNDSSFRSNSELLALAVRVANIFNT